MIRQFLGKCKECGEIVEALQDQEEGIVFCPECRSVDCVDDLDDLDDDEIDLENLDI